MAAISAAVDLKSSMNGTADPFDDPELDPVDFVNRIFPSEQQLSGLEPMLQNLRLRIRRVDGDILDAVRQQSSSGHRAKQDLDHAKTAIQDLFSRIRDIQAKAEQSELMVQEICRDIKKLDYAKRNLTATITVLRRLAMLVSAVDQLESMASKRRYKEAANMLEAVNQLSTHFDSFHTIPKICEMRGKIDTIKLMLRSSLFKDFEGLAHIDPERDSSAITAPLADACLVVDVLEPHVRDELLGEICNKEMTAYGQVFSTTGEVARLDRTERRYAWFKRQLRSKEEVWQLFPNSWRVPQMLCMYFCKITRAHLSQILDDNTTGAAAAAGGNIQAILLALHKTLEFEQELEERFGGQDAHHQEEEAGDDDPELSEATAASVRGKYERLRQGDETGGKSLPMAGAVAAAARASFKGSISSCFEPHLKAYVDLEERSFYELLDELVANETWTVEENRDAKVLGMAPELFLNIKKVYKRCSQLTRRETLFLLYQVFQKVLRTFAQKMVAKVPTPTAGMKPTDKDVCTICFIVNTAEYCRETVQPLGDSIARVLDKPFSDNIDMSAEEDEFSGVITRSLQVLVQIMDARLEEQLASLVKMSWSTIEAVGDQSQYVSTISSILNNFVPQIAGIINSTYFCFFCEKFIASIVPKVYQSILKCRRFSEAGAQQLLLDSVAMKQLLLDMPTLGGVLTSVPQSYTKMVNREMGKAEALLRVIMSPVEGLCDTFRALLPDSPPSDFKTVLDLKGLKKSEQSALTEEWSRRSGVATRQPAGMPKSAMNMPSMPTMSMPTMSMPSMSMSSMTMSSMRADALKSKLNFMRAAPDAGTADDKAKSSGSSIFNWSIGPGST
eukprot:CAMPEP_0114299464 /NCGR_PEP_ID=MMETSP0059-20121206/12989_1 /TAXON_ID=36894 /ORGANISM="Pyramimonas parkeae, Strain CCMP726" /LENGTH=843 /DNA_ID=CAMNT_0001421941 /DNA_START=19 /DNA_END=2550 /DNA_ORIENTATION=+